MSDLLPPPSVAELRERILATPWAPSGDFIEHPQDCPDAPHRGPQGPCEDLAQCPRCWAPSFAMRPEGETFGTHAPDCSLPAVHESYCKPGGTGHPAGVIRG